jgi:uridine kinase
MKMKHLTPGTLNLKKLAAHIARHLQGNRPYLIGIDGYAGSGKTTFLTKLVQALQNNNLKVAVVSMDRSFWKEIRTRACMESRFDPNRGSVGEDYDWRRLEAEILAPLRDGRTAVGLPISQVVVVEGCFSLRNELQEYYELKVFAQVPREIALERAIVRDGEGQRYWYENYWRQEEELYIRSQDPMRQADLVIDGHRETAADEVGLERPTPFSQQPGIAT